MDPTLLCCEGDTKVEIVGDFEDNGGDGDDDDEEGNDMLDGLEDIVFDEENADVLTDMHEANIKTRDGSGDDDK